MEKLALVKEVNKMKQLNSHLESRLEEQERRLCLVTSELSKTWHVVGRLRRHHHQLHTHEKILKYELQQKRKLLNELKDELEYCREKWEKAREKNSQSEKDWRKLRAEFSSRKTKITSPLFNNSGESGYSDERQSDDSSESNDESEFINAAPIRCKKKMKKCNDNVLDSSADFNLAAEREDPISDMLDVADLPLDSHELEETLERPVAASVHMELEDMSTSESCNFIKSDKTCDETEDEIGDVGFESNAEEQILDTSNLNDNIILLGKINSTEPENNSPSATTNELVPNNVIKQICSTERVEDIDPSDILENITKQNIMSVKSSSELLEKSKNTMLKGESLNNKLDDLLGHPSTSTEIRVNGENIESDTGKIAKTIIDPQQILQNIRNQTERLAMKDQRLKQMETGCNEVVRKITNTLNTSKQIEEKLDLLHKIREDIEENKISQTKTDTDDITKNNETKSVEVDIGTNKPSSSRDLNHEAIFAARDIRLKRLEEQTKSLVNKVNDTTTKRVKINYKLEELHNIYGSENSRAGTPAENDSGEDDEAKEEK